MHDCNKIHVHVRTCTITLVYMYLSTWLLIKMIPPHQEMFNDVIGDYLSRQCRVVTDITKVSGVTKSDTARRISATSVARWKAVDTYNF